MAKVAAKRAKNKDNARRSKKKISILNTERVEYVDYKDVRYLNQFLTPHARMNSGRKSAVPAGHQRKVEEAVKRARFMALLPYISR